MIAKGHTSARGAKSGVDVAPLAKAATVSREMARRYTEGLALPDAEKMQGICSWLGVRVPWLRDGEGSPVATTPHVGQDSPAAYFNLPPDAVEIARVWMKLPRDRRQWFRDLMCLEAVVANHYPWLVFGRPKSESYTEYERRIEREDRKSTRLNSSH